jgi:hypothetical protein
MSARDHIDDVHRHLSNAMLSLARATSSGDAVVADKLLAAAKLLADVAGPAERGRPVGSRHVRADPPD